jgi:hypothetical protein
MFGYRNRTENGTEKLVGSRKAAETKISGLKAAYPHIEWELIDIEIKQTPVTVWKSGQGRAGNSYRSFRMANTVGKVSVLAVY